MSIFEDSNTLVFVSTITNGYADADTWTAAAQPTGSVAFVKTSDNTVEKDALVAATEYRVIAKTTDGVVHYSPPFLGSHVKNAMGMDQEALVEQVTYLGYNGTSGSMDAANSTYYGLGIVLNHTFGMLNNSPLMLTVPYKSDSTATQSEVAAGLAIEATNVLKRQAYKPLKVERINAGAAADALGTATASVVNGGTKIVFSENMTALVTAGTILRLGGLGAGTTPCYIVTGHDSGVDAARIYTLDQPYQGATNATLAANLVESVTEGNWGLKFTGISVADADFNPVTDEPFVTSFELMTRDFVTATVTNTTVPAIGSGTYQLCSALEVYAQFQRKGKEISAYPRTNYLVQTTAGNLYHVYSFEIWNSAFVDATTGINPISPSRIVIIEDDVLNEAFNTVLGVTLVSAVI